jgi:hypothetical protein
LEAARDDAGDGEVFVEFLPAEGGAVEFEFDGFELIVGGGAEEFESIGGEADDAAVGEFEEDDAGLDPDADGDGFGDARRLSD